MREAVYVTQFAFYGRLDKSHNFRPHQIKTHAIEFLKL